MRGAADRPGIDRAATSEAGPAAQAALERAIADPALRAVARVDHQDARFALPTFLWATGSDGAPGRSVAAGRSTAGAAARDHLARVAPFYRLDRDDVREAALRNVHDTGRGGVIATFQQVIDGVEVFRDEMKLMLDREQGLVAVSGFLPARALLGRGAARAFALSDAEATARALADFTGAAVGAGLLRPAGEAGGGYRMYAVSTPLEGLDSERPLRVRKVWFHLPDGARARLLRRGRSPARAPNAYVIAARDGAILFRKDLVADDAYTYRVWADAAAPYRAVRRPAGVRADARTRPGCRTSSPRRSSRPNLVTLQSGPICDERSVAPARAPPRRAGNNVDAYADLGAPDGFSAGDLPRHDHRARHLRPHLRPRCSRPTSSASSAWPRSRSSSTSTTGCTTGSTTPASTRRPATRRRQLRPRRPRGRPRSAPRRRTTAARNNANMIDARRRRPAAHADVRLRRATGARSSVERARRHRRAPYQAGVAAFGAQAFDAHRRPVVDASTPATAAPQHHGAARRRARSR